MTNTKLNFSIQRVFIPLVLIEIRVRIKKSHEKKEGKIRKSQGKM